MDHHASTCWVSLNPDCNELSYKSLLFLLFVMLLFELYNSFNYYVYSFKFMPIRIFRANKKCVTNKTKKRHWPRGQKKNDSRERQKDALVLLRALAPSEVSPSSAPRRTKPLAKKSEEIPSVGFKILTPEEREPSGARNGTCRHLLRRTRRVHQLGSKS